MKIESEGEELVLGTLQPYLVGAAQLNPRVPARCIAGFRKARYLSRLSSDVLMTTPAGSALHGALAHFF